MRPLLRRLAALATGSLLTAGAQAAAFSDMVVFGDSLVDTGNVLALTTALSPPPFPSYPAAPGRFSNGPVWVESLAASLGLPAGAAPSRLIYNGTAVIPLGAPGGHDYAYGGARTGLGGSAGATTGLIGQLIAWNGSAFAASLTRAADPNALYVISGGANDMRDARTANPGGTPADVAARNAAAATAANNLVNVLALLAQAGARHFLVANLPDLGATPEAVALGNVPASTQVTLAFNAALAAALGSFDAFFLGLTGVDLDIDGLDMYGIAKAVTNDALTNGGGVYGITNITSPCLSPVAPGTYFAPGSVDVNCNVSLFSDPLHPSARGHAILGRAALAAVLAAPEPASVVLAMTALMALVAMRRRRVRT